MNREEKLVAIRRLLEREPSLQRRWVWECREKIQEYLIARYGAEAQDGSASRSFEGKPLPSLGLQPRRTVEAQRSPRQVRSILNDIARLNERSRERRNPEFPASLRN